MTNPVAALRQGDQALTLDGVAVTASAAVLNTAPAAVAAGYKIARGSTSLSGTNPTAVATGLSTIVSASVELKGSVAPGLSTSTLTTGYTGSDGTLNVYGWKPTSISNPTLIASTGTEAFDWIAIGT